MDEEKAKNLWWIEPWGWHARIVARAWRRPWRDVLPVASLARLGVIAVVAFVGAIAVMEWVYPQSGTNWPRTAWRFGIGLAAAVVLVGGPLFVIPRTVSIRRGEITVVDGSGHARRATTGIRRVRVRRMHGGQRVFVFLHKGRPCVVGVSRRVSDERLCRAIEELLPEWT